MSRTLAASYRKAPLIGSASTVPKMQLDYGVALDADNIVPGLVSTLVPMTGTWLGETWPESRWESCASDCLLAGAGVFGFRFY